MTAKLLYPALFLALTAGSFSCTSMKKYNALNAQKMDVEKAKAECDQNLAEANAKIQALNNLSTSKSARLEEMERDAKGQIERLSGDLETNQQRLKEKEKRLQELERALAEKDAAVNRLRATVQKALLGFRDTDLTVDIRNGKVYVSLAEQLLFKSGSTKVDPKGQDALQKLAAVLKEQQDVNVVVEGHTDDVPIARGTAGMKDNWDLSVLRATEITRILNSAGVPGARITPSGRSEFVPVEEGKNPEVRQKNRRTEIILTPKLDELFQILEKN